MAADLVGEVDSCAHAWEAAYARYSGSGDAAGAARCATWLGMGLMLRGEQAWAGGWFARAHRLVDEVGLDDRVSGYLLIPNFLRALYGGDVDTAAPLADEMVITATRFDDTDLLGLGLLSQGEVALTRGDVAMAMSRFDEAMVAVTGDELTPIFAGMVYCGVIDACVSAFDLRRAAEWTEALRRWCDAQPGLVAYRGACLVHRSQVLLARGSWSEAELEADRACERLTRPAHPALGLAIYQRAELHRLRGEWDEAERAYRSAHDHGQEPAPGLALLRLAQGRTGAAVASIRRMVDEHRDSLSRAPMLAAAVEIYLVAGEAAAARTAADELEAIAAQVAAPMLKAMAAAAVGAVVLAAGDPGAALEHLRVAHRGFRDLQMPYEAARVQLLIGRSCAWMGDDDASELEFAAARVTFEALGASADLVRAADQARVGAGRTDASGLTERERQVVRLVAAGKTNRDIAVDLVISEHTVGRHLQNIFRKLQVSSRAAATAYAYEHHLV